MEIIKEKFLIFFFEAIKAFLEKKFFQLSFKNKNF